MKIGVVGSRNLTVEEIGNYIPRGCKKIISGGAAGIDKCAAEYARRQEIELVEILPNYEKYGKAAPILRNKIIADESDLVIAFWNGYSRGTKMIIEHCKKINKACIVVKMLDDDIKTNLDNISLNDLTSVENRLIVLRDLTKVYSKSNYEIVENVPSVFCDIYDKLKSFYNRKNGKMEAEISIECLSACIKIVLPILFLSIEDIDLLNEIQEQISELILMSYRNKLKINVCVPYFVENESPYVKAWKKLNNECEINKIDALEELENEIKIK